MPRIPGVNHQDAVRALQKAGFRVARQGRHIVMTGHNPVNAFTMGGIVRDAGLSEEDFRALLQRLAACLAHAPHWAAESLREIAGTVDPVIRDVADVFERVLDALRAPQPSRNEAALPFSTALERWQAHERSPPRALVTDLETLPTLK